MVTDDLDLPTAKLRLRAKGSHGGHNGMRSIIAQMNGNGFPRLKIGVLPHHRLPVPSCQAGSVCLVKVHLDCASPEPAVTSSGSSMIKLAACRAIGAGQGMRAWQMSRLAAEYRQDLLVALGA